MNEAEVAAWKASWEKFEPITHKCVQCGADVVQSGPEVPPCVLFGPGWLCLECRAARGAEALRRSHEAGRRVAAELALWEARDAWERGEN